MRRVGRVLVPVAHQDRAIAFHTERPGFELVEDVPFAGGGRWVEVALAGGNPHRPRPSAGRIRPGPITGIGLSALDPLGLHVDPAARGVDVDAELVGGSDRVPLVFFLRDADGNQLFVSEER